jgi:hypothetical protein
MHVEHVCDEVMHVEHVFHEVMHAGRLGLVCN